MSHLPSENIVGSTQCLTRPCVFCAAAQGNPDAKRLYDDLLSNYNKLVRPVANVSDALEVKIKLKLSQLIDVVIMSDLISVM